MGKVSNDLDIVVELPDGGINLAHFLYHKGLSSRPVIFERFGTAQVVIDEHKIEFVMTRKESYEINNRKPDIKPGTIEEDIYRRDFTVNSLIIGASRLWESSRKFPRNLRILALSNSKII